MHGTLFYWDTVVNKKNQKSLPQEVYILLYVYTYIDFMNTTQTKNIGVEKRELSLFKA